MPHALPVFCELPGFSFALHIFFLFSFQIVGNQHLKQGENISKELGFVFCKGMVWKVNVGL